MRQVALTVLGLVAIGGCGAERGRCMTAEGSSSGLDGAADHHFTFKEKKGEVVTDYFSWGQCQNRTEKRCFKDEDDSVGAYAVYWCEDSDPIACLSEWAQAYLAAYEEKYIQEECEGEPGSDEWCYLNESWDHARGNLATWEPGRCQDLSYMERCRSQKPPLTRGPMWGPNACGLHAPQPEGGGGVAGPGWGGFPWGG